MKQVLQHLNNGQIEVVEATPPAMRAGHVLIQSSRSLVSPGTERMLREFGQASLIGKALKQPEKVRDVLQKAHTDGIATTIDAVRAKLDKPLPIGYCNVGRVIAVAPDVTGLAVGDRVVSNGPHAEIVRVSKNLVARIPDAVSDDQAAFTILGSIALQGIRLVEPSLGECVVVTGLGLIGLLAVQLLKAQGVRVLGIDVDPGRCALARQLGAETVCTSDGDDVVARAMDFSRGRGVDAVLICAATKSNEPIQQAAEMSRQRGRVILIGVVGLQIPRDEFYHKELSFRVSCSYGPGRYDSNYEDKGQDYPIGFVRWTEQRNFEAVLDVMAQGLIETAPFISLRFALEDAAAAYQQLSEGRTVLGILLEYAGTPIPLQPPTVFFPSPSIRTTSIAGRLRIGVIGAGNYASRHLIPAFQTAGAELRAICSSDGMSAALLARKFGFARATSSPDDLIPSEDIDLVVVATRHDSHAALVTRALRAGRAVFVEKPLAITETEIGLVAQAYGEAPTPFLMVGFNRRFAPTAAHIKRAIEKLHTPPVIIITVNAGSIPPEHWTQDQNSGGGRIIGEACHFIDLARHLAGAPIVETSGMALGGSEGDTNPEDKAIMTLRFANGAVATIQYLANGSKSFPKERVEVFCGNKIWQIDNFRRLRGFGVKVERANLFATQDKGQIAMAKAVMNNLRAGAPAPIAFDELVEITRETILLDRKLRRI